MSGGGGRLDLQIVDHLDDAGDLTGLALRVRLDLSVRDFSGQCDSERQSRVKAIAAQATPSGAQKSRNREREVPLGAGSRPGLSLSVRYAGALRASAA
jgi:hypothetical protein